MYRVYLIKIYGISIRSARCWKLVRPLGRAEHITEEQLDQLEESLLLSEFQMKKESGFSTWSRLRRWMVVFTLFSMKLREAEC